MRNGIPLIYCLPEDVQAKLRGLITDLDSLPDVKWSEWLPSETRRRIADYEKYKGVNFDKFMKQPRSRE